MIKAAIFDLDGTLADTLASIAHFANKALKTNGLPDIPIERYRQLVGDGAKTLVKRMLSEVGAPDSVIEQVYPLYVKSYDEDFLYKTKPYEGIIELLKTLYEKGIKIGIVSNKPDLTTVKIADNLFSPYISACVGQREGIAKKPDPKAVLAMLDDFAVKKSECIYIGDTKTDMNTGKNAGIFTIGVLWGFRDYNELIKSGADLIVASPHEIFDYVTKEL